LTQWLEKLIHDKNNNYLIKGGHKRFVFNNILLMNWPFKEHKPTIVAIEKKKRKKEKKNHSSLWLHIKIWFDILVANDCIKIWFDNKEHLCKYVAK